ncbi:MAG: hypothetical protein KAJ03_01045 [Gammaproteobacteria bacterium]|nr:hypothetical protein [Gammaproteobacteria bacterium]
MKKLLLSLLFLAQPALTAEEALTKCRQIEEIAERVVCYDKIADSHFPMESSDRVETTSPPEISKSNAVPDTQSLFGKNEAEAIRIVEDSLAIEHISQIEATVTDVRKSAYKKLTVTLDNGQIWRQLDSKPMPLKSGETVIVRAASLGSFLMEKQSGSSSIRVKRVN